MSTIRERIRLWIGDPGESLPSLLLRDHRGMFFSKRATGSADELHWGYADASDAMDTDRILTETYADTLYRPALSTATGWTAVAGAAMGTSPGSVAQAGGEHAGRVTQTTGGSGTTTGVLWTITLANSWGDTTYNVFLSIQNAETARCLPYVVVSSATVFTINAQVAPNTGAVLRAGWMIEERTS